MVVSLSRIGAVLNLLRNDSDVFNILESIPTNQNVHIYLADKADRGELFEDSSEAEDVEEESREDAKEHNATCNVKEANETIVEDANVEEPKTVEDTNVEEPEIVVEDVNVNVEESKKDANEHDATCNVEEADETIVEYANEHDENYTIHDAHDTTPKKYSGRRCSGRRCIFQ
ncbi:hypothetical protein V6N12_010868 [Hibiscus sabdariffa]|uniref:Uncharacterized protein n=1 Tax=Hibiscus sabdariffa TaxID=183260 RepID=A0ABR2ELC6_9ROSI